MMNIAFVATLLVGLVDVPKEAHQAGAEDDGIPRVHASLITDASSVTPGESFRVGVLFEMDEHYHIYWKNPGQAAIATDVRISGKGLRVGGLQWPAPTIFRQPDGSITTYGYTDHVLLFAPAIVADDAKGELTINVQADYLACKVECTPGSATLSRTIPIRDVSTPAPANITQLFDRFEARVPRAANDLGLGVTVAYDVSAVKPNTTFKAALALVACAGPTEHCVSYQVPGNAIDEAFVPERIPGVELKAVAMREHPNAFSGLIVDVAGISGPDEPAGNARFNGVLELERDDGKPVFVMFDTPLPRAPSTASVTPMASALLPVPVPVVIPTGPAQAALPALALWQALLLAFIGGLVLNLMPCVLPVLAIKVTGFTALAKTSATHGRSIVFAHAMAYTAGIIAAMLSLALAVLALRFGGRAVGWGFQFQEPLFVAIVAGVLVAFALNLFGVFELNVGAGHLSDATYHAHGLTKSVLEGVLAVVVATPCSAPYLGTAVGFALAGNAWVVIAAFVTIGLGLAAPFVLLTAIPKALALVPKPGMWMVRLKQGMGFALLATVLWLGWVVGNVAGVDGQAQVLGFALAVGLGTWMISMAKGRSRWPVRAIAVTVVMVVGAALLRFDEEPHTVVRVVGSELTWEPFHKDRISAELAKGNVVFVDFTADWCITCKVNEHAVLGSQRISDATKKFGVQLFKADWTHRDEVIRAELAAHGKAGVPMYLVYSPKTPNTPTVLPELLTADIVVAALEAARASM